MRALPVLPLSGSEQDLLDAVAPRVKQFIRRRSCGQRQVVRHEGLDCAGVELTCLERAKHFRQFDLDRTRRQGQAHVAGDAGQQRERHTLRFRQSDDTDIATATRGEYVKLRRSRRADRVQYTIDPLAAGRRADVLQRMLGGNGNRAQPGRGIPPIGNQIDSKDALCAHGYGGEDTLQTDGAQPDHGRARTWPHPGQLCARPGRAEVVGHHDAQPIGNTFGQPVQVEIGDGHFDSLRLAATQPVHALAENPASGKVAANHWPTLSTGFACAAADRARHEDAVTDLEATDAGTHFDDLAHRLVADAVAGAGRPDMVGMEIAAADSAFANFDDCRAGAGDDRIRYYLAADVARATKEDRKSTRLNSRHVEISYADFC